MIPYAYARQFSLGILAAGLWVAATVCGSNTLAAAEKLPSISGRVILDANANGQADKGEAGISGVAVTDGVNVFLTDDEGRFDFQMAADEVIPYLPARTVAVSWPSGHWPQGRWFYRMSQLKPGKPLEFLLIKQKQELPFGIVHGTDPHDSFRREFNITWREDVRRMGKLIDLAVVTGDLSYISRKNADKDLGDVRTFTDSFPVPMFHTPGNHDIADIHTAAWKEPHDLAGNGGFTKHLGPVRWSFDYAGVHLVGIDWARPLGDTLETGMPSVAEDWLERDLARLPKGTRTFLFAHQFWSPQPKLMEVVEKYGIELMLGGHSHRNIDLSNRKVKMLTTMSLSKLLHVYKDRYELADFCQGYRPANPGYHGKFCNVREVKPIQVRRGDVVFAAGMTRVSPDGLPLTAEAIGPGVEAKLLFRFGYETPAVLTLTPEDDDAEAISIRIVGNTIQCDGLTTAAGRRPDDPHFALHVLLDHGGLEVRANGRVYFCRQRIRPQGKWHVSFAAPERGVLFLDSQIWPIAAGDPKLLEQVAMHYRSVYQSDRAEPYWRAILRQDPNHTTANLSLGQWLLERERGAEAEPMLKRLSGDKKHARNITLWLAGWYSASGQEEKTIATYKDWLTKKNDDKDIKNKLAWVYLTAQDRALRDAKAAEKLARELCAATENKDAHYLDTLCVALAEAGEYDEAIKIAKLGFEKSKPTNNRLLTENMRMRIRDFTQRKAQN